MSGGSRPACLYLMTIRSLTRTTLSSYRTNSCTSTSRSSMTTRRLKKTKRSRRFFPYWSNTSLSATSALFTDSWPPSLRRIVTTICSAKSSKRSLSSLWKLTAGAVLNSMIWVTWTADISPHLARVSVSLSRHILTIMANYAKTMSDARLLVHGNCWGLN